MTTIPKLLDLTTMNQKDNRQKLLRTIGYKVLSDINDVSVVMPTALVSYSSIYDLIRI